MKNTRGEKTFFNSYSDYRTLGEIAIKRHVLEIFAQGLSMPSPLSSTYPGNLLVTNKCGT